MPKPMRPASAGARPAAPVASSKSLSSESSSSSSSSSSAAVPSPSPVDFSGLRFLSLRLDDGEDCLRVFVKPAGPARDVLLVSAGGSAEALAETELEAALAPFCAGSGAGAAAAGAAASSSSSSSSSSKKGEAKGARGASSASPSSSAPSSLAVLRRGTVGEDESALHFAVVRLPTAAAAARLCAAPSAFAGAGAGASAAEGGGPGVGSGGLRTWLARHAASAKPDARALQAAADSHMAGFDAAEGEARRRKEELGARMQADGFTLVTRKSRLAGEGEWESENIKKKRKRDASASALSAEALAAGGVAAVEGGGGGGGGGARGVGGALAKGFYQFQHTAAKLERLERLRAQFAEDKEHIKKIKAERRFKPV
jgi:hypothetical protein